MTNALSRLVLRLRRGPGQGSADDRAMAQFPEMNPGPVCRVDRSGTILLANAAARAVFGEDLLAGRSWLDVCPGISPEFWTRILEATEPVQHEVQVAGRHFVFALTRPPDGDQVFAYGTDITRLKAAEHALERQARELAEMARFPDTNPGPVCRMDREARIVLANPAARALFGRDDLAGESWLRVCPGMDPAAWARVLEATELVHHEAAIGDRHLLFALTPGTRGRDIFAYGSDLTALKRTERALHQSEKMATLGTLAAGVAHELNNPAAAAQRAAEQLQAAVADFHQAELNLLRHALDDAALRRLEDLADSVRAAAGRTDDLDPLSRSDREAEIDAWLERRGVQDAWELAPAFVDMGHDTASLDALAGSIEDAMLPAVLTWLARAHPVYALLHAIHHGAARVSEIVGALKAYSYLGRAPLQAVDINEGLRNTLVILRNKLKQGITVEQELAEDLPKIQGYGGELNQVWTNLIDNAADAMDGRGRIALRSHREHDWIIVEVEDDGPGIPEEIQPRIFDPFFTTKPPGHGTGLGLNTTYNIVVDKHRGRIAVSSRPGCTRFIVKLPLEHPPAEA